MSIKLHTTDQIKRSFSYISLNAFSFDRKKIPIAWTIYASVLNGLLWHNNNMLFKHDFVCVTAGSRLEYVATMHITKTRISNLNRH